MRGFLIYVRRFALVLSVAVAALVATWPVPSARAADGAPVVSDVDGITLVSQDTGRELAQVCVFVRAGSTLEDPANYGVTGLLNDVILSTSPSAGSDAVFAIERLGGSVSVESTAEYGCFRLSVPEKNLAASLNALGAAISAPPLNEPSLASAKRRVAGIDALSRDMPLELGYDSCLCNAYPGSAPGLCPHGATAALGVISLSALSDWHKAHYVRKNVVVSICAGTDAAKLKKMAGEAFAGLRPGPSAEVPETTVSGSRAVTGDADASGATGSIAIVGYAGPPAGSPDFAAMKLAEAAVSGGMGSRMFRALRVDGKLAYSFGGMLMPMTTASRLVFYVSADPGSMDKAVNAIDSSVDAVGRGGLTSSEFKRARALAAGEVELAGESDASRAWRAGLAETLGLGQGYWDRLADRIRSLDGGDIAGAARKYMGGRTLVVMGPDGSGG